MIIEDAGHGITRKSLDLYKARKKELGKIISIQASREPLDEHEHTMIISGTEGFMKLSGCTSGYGGEGPNGTRQILETLGVPSDIARKYMLMRAFTINFGDTKDF